MRGSPHVHSIIWILNPPKLSEEILGTYIKFIDNTIHANLPAPHDDSVLYESVYHYRTHNTQKIVENIWITYSGLDLANSSQIKKAISAKLLEDCINPNLGDG